MSAMRDLPDHVYRFIESGVVTEYVTVSVAGVPIDTPTYFFPSDDMRTIDIATGLANPAKAERARRNPKVGLLMEGAAAEPVVAIRGHAAVRDANLQANTERYIAETGFKSLAGGLTWADARKTTAYWTRIIVEITPARIMWWDNQAAMEDPPRVWNAPADTVYPQSDPAPAGKVTPPIWPVRPWREVAQESVARGGAAHLAVCDEDGYPQAMRTRRLELVDDGFRLDVARGAPCARRAGKASLTFAGIECFLGEVTPDGDALLFKAERALPETPANKNTKLVLQPTDEIRAKMMGRVEAEAKRRGQSVPTPPMDVPPLTRIAQLRQQRMASGVPITGISAERGNRQS